MNWFYKGFDIIGSREKGIFPLLVFLPFNWDWDVQDRECLWHVGPFFYSIDPGSYY